VNASPASPAADLTESRRDGRRLWAWAFAGLFLLLGAWAVAAPYSGFPDEQDHILRAYGVVTGQIVLTPAEAANGGGAFVNAPRSLVIAQCWQFHSDVPASCAAEPGGDETVERAATAAGRYFPVYYALVGAPLAIAPNWTGVLLARLISAGLCAFLLANALVDVIRWSRHRVVVAGYLVATTPMVAQMGGSVNPSGLELAAGVALFSSAICLLFVAEARRNATLLWHLGVAGLALATLRMLGPLWLLLAVLALLLPWRRATLADLWGWRALRGWVLGVVAATVLAVVWTFVSKSTDANPYFSNGQPLSPFNIAWTEIQRWSDYISEMIGVTSWLDAKMPGVAYVAWTALAGAVVIWGYLLADRAGRLRLFGLAVAGIAVPLAITVATANTFGFITQGRYLLPVLVGLPLLASLLIDRSVLPADTGRALLRCCVLVTLPIQVVALAFTMMRWQQGQRSGAGLNPLAGSWHPVLGSPTPLVLALLGVAVIGWLTWTAGDGRSARAPRHAAGQAP
jgi:hypothetical protein